MHGWLLRCARCACSDAAMSVRKLLSCFAQNSNFSLKMLEFQILQIARNKNLPQPRAKLETICCVTLPCKFGSTITMKIKRNSAKHTTVKVVWNACVLLGDDSLTYN
jgi:hypothetical protein